MHTAIIRIFTILLMVGCQSGESRAQVGTDASAPRAQKAPLKIATSKQGPVSITALSQFGSIHPNSTPGLNVLVKLQADKAVDAQRPPLDLAIVLDTSGSMSGEKIRDAKKAALEMLGALQESDRVTLVAYSTSVRRLTSALRADAKGKQILRDAILRLSSGGSTALGPALFTAFDALRSPSSNELRLRHVVLMSDGLANIGEKRPAVLGARAADAFRNGISVSTMGVGLDYNEDLMTRVADQGGGRYHFIKESSAIAGILADELKGLVATVARSVVLSFHGTPGVTLTKVFGYPVDKHDGSTHVRVGFMGSEQLRELVMRFELSPAVAKQIAGGILTLGRVGLEYSDVAADGAKRRIELGLSVGVASTAAAATKTENTEVSIRVAEVETAEKMQVAARSAQRGDFGRASGTLQVAIDGLKAKDMAAPSPRLKKQIASFEEALDEVSKAKTSRRAQKAYTKKYKARAYKQSK